MKKLINPKFHHLSGMLDTLTNADYFDSQGEVLYDVGRNVVKRFQIEGVDVVVKRFGRITTFNRLMYATVRESKAMRAYKFASKLREMGISTPEEIAVMETFAHGMMGDSYFISEYTSYDSISYLRYFTYERREWFPLLDALATWIFGLHEKGILHQDLNVGNILHQRQKDGSYAFQLIDNNRMKFCQTLSLEERLKDICRLSTNLDFHLYFLTKYAELMPQYCNRIKMKGCAYKLMFAYRQMVKKKMRKPFVHS